MLVHRMHAFTGVFLTVAGVSPSSWEASSAAPLADATMLRWVRSRNVYRPRTGGDRRDRRMMLMKRFIVPLQVVVTVSDQLLLMRATKE